MKNEALIEEIEIEIARIVKLLREYEPLLEKVKTKEPDFIELASLAMLLHSFYNGIEFEAGLSSAKKVAGSNSKSTFVGIGTYIAATSIPDLFSTHNGCPSWHILILF